MQDLNDLRFFAEVVEQNGVKVLRVVGDTSAASVGESEAAAAKDMRWQMALKNQKLAAEGDRRVRQAAQGRCRRQASAERRDCGADRRGGRPGQRDLPADRR